MSRPDCTPESQSAARPPVLPWAAVAIALPAGIGGLALLSWVGANLVI
jgi:hypothetical protein